MWWYLILGIFIGLVAGLVLIGFVLGSVVEGINRAIMKGLGW